MDHTKSFKILAFLLLDYFWLVKVQWVYIGGSLRLYWQFIGVILVVHWGYIGGSLELYWRFIGGDIAGSLGLYCIMPKIKSTT